MQIEQAREYVGPLDRWEIVRNDGLDLLREYGWDGSQRIADLGAGCLRHGSVLAEDTARNGGYYIAIEPNTEVFDAGYQELPDYLKGFVDHRTDASLKFKGIEDRSLDFIFARSVLSHADHYQAGDCIEAALNKLKPNGVFLFSFYPASWKRGEWITLRPGWRYPGATRLLRAYLQMVAADYDGRLSFLDWRERVGGQLWACLRSK